MQRLPPMHTLAAFEASARLGTFSQAAEELSVTNSAISHRIRLLEDHLGCRLFVREPKHVRLTRQGQHFLESVRTSIDLLTSSARTIADAAPGDGRLSVTVAPGLGNHILIPRIGEFIQAGDGLDLRIDTSPRVVDLDQDGFDIAIRLGGGSWPGYASEFLAEEKVFAFASERYVREFGRGRGFGALGRATLIHSDDFSWRRWFELQSQDFDGFRGIKSGLRFKEVCAALTAAEQGLGVVLANQGSAFAAQRDGRLIPFVECGIDYRKHYFAVYNQESVRLPLIRAFLDWAQPAIKCALNG